MKASLAILGVTFGLLQSASAQQVDMQAMMRWSSAKVARFHVVGVYAKRTVIAYGSGAYAQADVRDKLTLDFDWNINDNALVGAPKFRDESSSSGALGSVQKGCKPPVPRGVYEHFTAKSVRPSQGPRIEVEGTRHYPDVDVAGCEADQSYRRVAKKDEPITELIAVPNPMMLAVPGAGAGSGSGNVGVAPDGKSFVVKANGWTWTYTPTPL